MTHTPTKQPHEYMSVKELSAVFAAAAYKTQQDVRDKNINLVQSVWRFQKNIKAEKDALSQLKLKLGPHSFFASNQELLQELKKHKVDTKTMTRALRNKEALEDTIARHGLDRDINLFNKYYRLSKIVRLARKMK